MWHQILTYFYLRKPDKDAPTNINIKAMHIINKISLFVFLIAIIIMITRAIIRN